MDPLLELVGIPYKLKGRTPEDGFDCWGLVLWANKLRGINLSENPLGWRDRGAILQEVKDYKRHDILCLGYKGEQVEHVGVAINGTDFIHAGAQYGGVVCDVIRRYPMQCVARLDK